MWEYGGDKNGYYPSYLEPYARRRVDVGEVAVALYAAGVTQGKAAEVMSLLLGHRYTHETVSATLERLEAFRQRPLPEELAAVYLDGLFPGRPGGLASSGVCGAGHLPEIVAAVRALLLPRRKKAPQGRKPCYSDELIIALAVYQHQPQ